MLLRRFAATVAATGVAILGPAAVAQAHVRVNPDSATPGSYTTLTFKVPTESATASTQKIVVDIPIDHPFGSVAYQQVPGWTVKVTTSKLATPVTTDDGTITEAPTKIVWTASSPAARIAPGQFQTFPISVGPVPDVGTVMMPAHQTYTDGSTVDWADATPASGKEPEHPAPLLYVKTAPPATGGTSAGVTASPKAAAASEPAAKNTDSTGTWLGVAGIGVGAVALIVAAYAATRSRRPLA